MNSADSSAFPALSDDVVLNIFYKLEDDPRNSALLACACTKFSSLIRNVCWKTKCRNVLPSVVSDEPLGGWSSLHKLAVCCPGLLHSGVLFENSDFGLERELGPDDNFRRHSQSEPSSSSSGQTSQIYEPPPPAASSDCTWSLFDDLYFVTVYDESEAMAEEPDADAASVPKRRHFGEYPIRKRRKILRSMRSHLASGVWSLSREQGNKLFYICDWPGCVHIEEKRNYMLFRVIGSQDWRNIKDGKRSKVELIVAVRRLGTCMDRLAIVCLMELAVVFHFQSIVLMLLVSFQ